MIVYTDYEYAGFRYNIYQDESGQLWAKAQPGQHKNAYKEKHVKAATANFSKDYGWNYTVRFLNDGTS